MKKNYATCLDIFEQAGPIKEEHIKPLKNQLQKCLALAKVNNFKEIREMFQKEPLKDITDYLAAFAIHTPPEQLCLELPYLNSLQIFAACEKGYNDKLAKARDYAKNNKILSAEEIQKIDFKLVPILLDPVHQLDPNNK